ncbi:hypothetical protein B296_00010969 [Ensete ventricosum]|uniref:Uncharacterized protein n=1 Tax=Ensete ventricosum TaxID=4639 RepID=A0A427AYQ0_ENSVE|nr:hypothetical protein B296_00010969 [Ensete ventricosum]
MKVRKKGFGSEINDNKGLIGIAQIYDVDEEDDSRLMDLRYGMRRWMKATSKAIMGIAWKMEAAEIAIG